MAVHGSGGAAARPSESFQQTGDKDTRGRRVFGRVKNISYFLDHVETVRMCTASASSQTCRPVLQGYDVFFGPKLNNPLYSSGEPKPPAILELAIPTAESYYQKEIGKAVTGQ